MKIDFDRIASACAIFVAIIALVVAVYEARVTREHQEVSVWPNLTRYNTSIAKIGDRNFNFGVYLKNNGIGPALIKKISYKYKGKEYERMTEIIREIMLPEKALDLIYTDKAVVKVLLPGKEVLLTGANFQGDQKNFSTPVLRIIFQQLFATVHCMTAAGFLMT